MKTANFSCLTHPELQKKITIQRNIHLRTIIPSGNPLSIYSQINKILDQTPSSALCPHVKEGS